MKPTNVRELQVKRLSDKLLEVLVNSKMSGETGMNALLTCINYIMLSGAKDNKEKYFEYLDKIYDTLAQFAPEEKKWKS